MTSEEWIYLDIFSSSENCNNTGWSEWSKNRNEIQEDSILWKALKYIEKNRN